MIGSLEGVVGGIIRNTIVLQVHSIGYRIATPLATLTSAKEGDKLFLWTHLAVRENSQDLYGFPTKEELLWFELLLSVSGIGPKSALNIMNSVDTKSLERAVGSNNASMLSKAFGLGKKTAEKIVLELRGKVAPTESTGHNDSDVVEALVGLGYSLREAREAVQSVPKEITETESKIREAIRLASRQR